MKQEDYGHGYCTEAVNICAIGKCRGFGHLMKGLPLPYYERNNNSAQIKTKVSAASLKRALNFVKIASPHAATI